MVERWVYTKGTLDISWPVTVSDYFHPLQSWKFMCCITARLRSGKDTTFPSLIVQVGTQIYAQSQARPYSLCILNTWSRGIFKTLTTFEQTWGSSHSPSHPLCPTLTQFIKKKNPWSKKHIGHFTIFFFLNDGKFSQIWWPITVINHSAARAEDWAARSAIKAIRPACWDQIAISGKCGNQFPDFIFCREQAE